MKYIMTTKQLLMGVIAVFAIATTVSIVNTAYATHGEIADGWWASPSNVEYWYDQTSLNTLSVTSSVDPDGNLEDGNQYWTSITSGSLDYDPQPVPGNEEVMYDAKSLGGFNGQTTLTMLPSTKQLLYAHLYINNDPGYDWGDKVGADWWKWWVGDYLSVSYHENGHTIRLDHDTNANPSDLMYNGHAFGTVYRTATAHDISSVEAKYP